MIGSCYQRIVDNRPGGAGIRRRKGTPPPDVHRHVRAISPWQEPGLLVAETETEDADQSEVVVRRHWLRQMPGVCHLSSNVLLIPNTRVTPGVGAPSPSTRRESSESFTIPEIEKSNSAAEKPYPTSP